MFHLEEGKGELVADHNVLFSGTGYSTYKDFFKSDSREDFKNFFF
jgi:hypothetical protein